MGMWDQNLALRWVNIGAFGGNSDNCNEVAVYRFAEGCGICVNVCINEIICRRHDAICGIMWCRISWVSPSFSSIKNSLKAGNLTSDLPGQKYSFVAPDLLCERSLKLAALAGFNVNNWDNC